MRELYHIFLPDPSGVSGQSPHFQLPRWEITLALSNHRSLLTIETKGLKGSRTILVLPPFAEFPNHGPHMACAYGCAICHSFAK